MLAAFETSDCTVLVDLAARKNTALVAFGLYNQSHKSAV